MVKKEHIPRFFLYTGSILIFISLFLIWETITDIMSGKTRYEYGFERLEVIILLCISFIPILLYEFKKKFSKRYLSIIFFEVFVLSLHYRMYALIFTVETGIGFYIALLGIFFQFIGIITAIIIERINN